MSEEGKAEAIEFEACSHRYRLRVFRRVNVGLENEGWAHEQEATAELLLASGFVPAASLAAAESKLTEQIQANEALMATNTAERAKRERLAKALDEYVPVWSSRRVDVDALLVDQFFGTRQSATPAPPPEGPASPVAEGGKCPNEAAHQHILLGNACQACGARKLIGSVLRSQPTPTVERQAQAQAQTEGEQVLVTHQQATYWLSKLDFKVNGGAPTAVSELHKYIAQQAEGAKAAEGESEWEPLARQRGIQLAQLRSELHQTIDSKTAGWALAASRYEALTRLETERAALVELEGPAREIADPASGPMLYQLSAIRAALAKLDALRAQPSPTSEGKDSSPSGQKEETDHERNSSRGLRRLRGLHGVEELRGQPDAEMGRVARENSGSVASGDSRGDLNELAAQACPFWENPPGPKCGARYNEEMTCTQAPRHDGVHSVVVGAVEVFWGAPAAEVEPACTCPLVGPKAPSSGPGKDGRNAAFLIGHQPGCPWHAWCRELSEKRRDAHVAAGGQLDWAGDPISAAEVEQATGEAKGEMLRCSFCLGSWPVVDDGMVAVIRGPEACICQSCAWSTARIADEHAERYAEKVGAIPPSPPTPGGHGPTEGLVTVAALRDMVGDVIDEENGGARWVALYEKLGKLAEGEKP